MCAVCCGVWCVLHANTGRSEEERREGQHTVCCSVLCAVVLHVNTKSSSSSFLSSFLSQVWLAFRRKFMQHARETQIMMDMMVTWFEGEVLIGCLEVFKGNHLCVCVCV